MFSDFSMNSDFFNSTHLKIIFGISHLKYVPHGFMIDSDFQKKVFVLFQTFSLKLTYTPVN